MRDNLMAHPAAATRVWVDLRSRVHVEDDELTFDWPLMFDATKDKPVLCTALASADVLLTPGDFLHSEREAGRLQA